MVLISLRVGRTAVSLDPKSAGVTVGSKAIVRLPGGASNASAVRFSCKAAIAANDAAFGATLSAFSLHTLVGPTEQMVH